MEDNDQDRHSFKRAQSNEPDNTIQIAVPGRSRPRIINTSDNYWRRNTRESKQEAAVRRSRGILSEELQKGGFVLDGVNADKWFASLDLPPDTPTSIQQQTAVLLVNALVPTAEWSGLVREVENNVRLGQLGMLVMRTNIYLRLAGISKLRISLAAALVADLITHSTEVALGASAVAALWDNVRRLSEDELEVFHAMQRISNGQVYTEWLRTEAIIHALPKGKKKSHWQSALASMKSRGILEEGAGMWRAVR